jgi:tetratricopeptide (TPR) repeat protein
VSTRERLLEQAATARDLKDYRAARDAYIALIDLEADDGDAMWALAHAEFELALREPENYDTHGHAAISWMRRAEAKRSDLPHYNCSLAMMLEQVEVDYHGAAQLYRAALETEPDYVGALVGLASLYSVPGNVVDLSDAIIHCERAIRIRPTRSLWLLLSELYAYSGRRAESLQALEQSRFWPYDECPWVF